MATGTHERSEESRDVRQATTRELVQRLLAEVQRLVRDDLLLIRAELRQDARGVATGGVALAVGALLGTSGFLVLTFTAVYLLAMVVPLWVSGLVVGGALGGAGGLLVWGATQEARKVARSSRETAHAVGRELSWARDKTA